MQRVGDDARFEHVIDADLVNLDELQVGHRLDRLGVAHRVLARRHRNLGQLFGGRAVLVHVPVRDHGVVGDQGRAIWRFHVLLPGGAAAAKPAGPDRDAHRSGGGAVGRNSHIAATGSDIAQRVRGVKLVG